MVSWNVKRHCPQLSDLANIVKPAILDCKTAIETFIEKVVTKYGKSLLRQVGSRKTFRDIVKMIQWNMSEKEHVEKLREKLSHSKETILLVCTQAQS